MRTSKQHRTFKDALYAEFAVVGKALANAHRLELLDLLAQGERSVEELAQQTAQSLANTSAHLQVLRRARLVEAEKRGLHVVYRLAAPEVFQLWRALRDLGRARLAEVERLAESFFTDRSALVSIDKEELLRQIAADAVTVLDVRPATEYHQGHILNARSIPVAELEQRLAELPRDRAVVAYCRGPYCVFADEAVEILRRHGFQAQRLQDGFPEWQADGYPIAAASGPQESSRREAGREHAWLSEGERDRYADSPVRR
ncbi:MAG: metalloregulator ArsR/SmtB family transcription factor [Chloroflexi bacterium]|nr:metalloregulator ArsR/SmtB family transcription factor [Chloroflexota bacterium]